MIEYPGNIVIFAGRRWGKTDGSVYRIYRGMVNEPGLYWWIGLTWRSASMKRAWRLTSNIARQILSELKLPEQMYINRSNFEIRLPGLGEIWFRTADNPASLTGEGIRGAVVDEFSLMREIVWVEYLEATLLDYGGWAAFLGVPKGNNWAANLWRAAAGREGWLQLQATTYENPFIPAARIDQVRREAPERFFNQEYLAQIVDDAGLVFRRVMDAATANEQASDNSQYVMGVDWGKHNDYTVLTVMDIKEKSMVAMDRFNQIDYVTQAERLKSLAGRYRPANIIAESNSMGEPVIDRLQQEGLPVTGFTTTNATKAAAIQALQMAFENREIEILNDPVLIGELQSYELKRLPSGMTRYSAPEGMHDDCVMSLALAWQGVVDSGPLLLWGN